MSFFRRQRDSIVWLALVAMLAFALMPTVSRTLSLLRSASWLADICSTDLREAGSTGSDSGQMPGVGHLDHCGFCSLSAHSPALPPALETPVAPQQVQERPPLFYASARPLFAWHAAQPRGPPASFS